MRPILPAMLFVFALAGCATPQTAYLQGTAQEIAHETEKQKALALQQELKQNKRLQNIAFPILARNKDLCGVHVGPYWGFSAWSIDDVAKTYKDVAIKLYDLGENTQVSSVVAGSPAAKAGLQSGDKIIAINGTEIKKGSAGTKQVFNLLDTQKFSPATLTLQKKAKPHNVKINPAAACDFNVIYQDDDNSINASADGKNIYVPKGMMRFAQTDPELALVLAHELGHNAIEHSAKKQQNALGAGLAGLMIEVAIAAAGGGTGNGSLTRSMMDAGAQAHSVGFEQEADYVGMYMMTRAGYPTANVASFWRRMASEGSSSSIYSRGSHPTSPERFVAIEKAHKEIAAKKASGKALTPNMQEPVKATTTAAVRKNE